MRKALADIITQATGGVVQGLVMEEEDDLEDELPHDKFLRIEEGFDVVGFVLLYPRNSNTDGVRVEEGMLLRDIQRGRRTRIVAFFEEGVATERDGEILLQEEGRRTTYTAGLMALASNVRLGVALDDLPALVAREARYMAFEAG